MRDSKVKSVYLNSMEFSAVFQVGDSVGLYPFSIAHAVQKERPIFIDEYDYFKDNDTILSEPLPNFLAKSDTKVTRHNNNSIRVNSLISNGVTGSGIIHIGSFNHGKAISILKHKRIIQNDR
ncbi:spore germination protein GerPE [Tenuibacillus multivorans]|uniref:Spore germination protein PE n=1 Tax=Tenuibacillus multivorans TaxID=237069 RepID=A0A1G9ZZP1_9BACI|nr:spore germination protein GerPE [Tenuibacillus multivorans]GEL78351.1 hypothetical protein TMU01_25860 [Tenuibacillus multivorans]SDN27092.1 Protein of unknown function [Tenuibacillus multivorans]